MKEIKIWFKLGDQTRCFKAKSAAIDDDGNVIRAVCYMDNDPTGDIKQVIIPMMNVDLIEK